MKAHLASFAVTVAAVVVGIIVAPIVASFLPKKSA